MANDPNLENLTHEQLRSLAEKVQAQMGKLQRGRRSEVRAKVTQLLKAEGFTFEDLYGAGRGGKPSGGESGKAKIAVKPKYRNPADATQTWSGRGKRPRWFQAALTAGKKDTDLLV